jgi:hypothetical protein
MMGNNGKVERVDDASICQRLSCPFIDLCPIHPRQDCVLCDVLKCGQDMERLQVEVHSTAGQQNECLTQIRMLAHEQARVEAARNRTCVHA